MLLILFGMLAVSAGVFISPWFFVGVLLAPFGLALAGRALKEKR